MEGFNPNRFLATQHGTFNSTKSSNTKTKEVGGATVYSDSESENTKPHSSDNDSSSNELHSSDFYSTEEEDDNIPDHKKQKIDQSNADHFFNSNIINEKQRVLDNSRYVFNSNIDPRSNAVVSNITHPTVDTQKLDQSNPNHFLDNDPT